MLAASAGVALVDQPIKVSQFAHFAFPCGHRSAANRYHPDNRDSEGQGKRDGTTAPTGLAVAPHESRGRRWLSTGWLVSYEAIRRSPNTTTTPTPIARQCLRQARLRVPTGREILRPAISKVFSGRTEPLREPGRLGVTVLCSRKALIGALLGLLAVSLAVCLPVVFAKPGEPQAALPQSPVEQTTGTLAEELEVLRVSTSSDIDPSLCTPQVQYKEACAVVIGEVTELLPLRQNIDERYYQKEEVPGYLPVYYMGYRMSVSSWMGPAPAPKSITVYSIGSGTGVIDGKTVEHISDIDPDITVGETYVVPLRDTCLYGVALGQNEFWAIGDGVSIYRVFGESAVRAVPLEDLVPAKAGVQDETTLHALVDIAQTVGLYEDASQ